MDGSESKRETGGSHGSANIVELWRAAERMPQLASAQRQKDTASPQKQSSGNVENVENFQSDFVRKTLATINSSDLSAQHGRMQWIWPYRWEKYAMISPMPISTAVCCISSSLIAVKINSDLIGFNAQMSFAESIRTLPKKPWIFAVYVAGLGHVISYGLAVNHRTNNEIKSCFACLIAAYTSTIVLNGTIVPALSTPFMCGILLKNMSPKYPEPKNLLEMAIQGFYGSKAAWPRMAQLVTFQIALGIGLSYALAWGNDRFYRTLNEDPDLAVEIMERARNQDTLGDKLKRFLERLNPIKDDSTSGQMIPPSRGWFG